LIGDLLEQQTVSQARVTWDLIELFADKIIAIFSSQLAKYALLRFCNSLLRKLSKSCHTEFCGRVLLFLTALYPISEKSAVNLTGKINQNNTTTFDSEEQFLQYFVEADVAKVSSILLNKNF